MHPVDPATAEQEERGPVYLRDRQGTCYAVFHPDAQNIQIKRGPKTSMFDLRDVGAGDVLVAYQTVENGKS